jgi:type IV pilus assembly protein PilW
MSKRGFDRHMAGFSLVELMVALVLGALITLAAVQLFGANQRAFMTQQNLTRVLDDGQLGLRFLSNDFRLAGYSGGPVSNVPGVLFTGPQGSIDGATHDRITVQYSGTQDCQGSVSTAAVLVTNAYQVNNNAELTCQGSLSAGAPVALLSGVEGFRIQYGIDTDMNGEPGPFRFMGATDAQASGRPIVAVRIGLLLAVESPSLPLGEARTWHVLDRSIVVPADQVLRRTFHTTVMLRNLDWEQI